MLGWAGKRREEEDAREKVKNVNETLGKNSGKGIFVQGATV
jgi:hypothetical protein